MTAVWPVITAAEQGGLGTPPHDPRYTFYAADAYRAELTRMVRLAGRGDKILLTTMTFEPTEPQIASLIHQLILAAQRGADVTLAVDAHSFLIHHGMPGPLLYQRSLEGRLPTVFRQKLRLLNALEAQSTGHAVIINKPHRRGSLVVAGRSHIKLAIVNDTVFVGGCNLQGTSSIDMMVSWTDGKSAGELAKVMHDILRAQHAHAALGGTDRQLPLGPSSSLLIDAGGRGQSLILEEALRLIDSAQTWLLITCQFFPNSVTARHLKAAHDRGVKVEVVFAHPAQHGIVGGFGQRLSLLRERVRVPKPLFVGMMNRHDPLLHAKLIACDQGAMLGSHNYVRAGVLLGTAELSILSRDGDFAREAVNTLRQRLHGSS